ncbi:kinesin family protein [Cordyceps fumosorosea ARSEF 2679]|uniref:Kinesin-like protein n=1 Tax=Cordyceps fumosorosea (strain ARSEF 2679) TaxID=1081104 RepID=A0A167MR16_CORFA|nr:kinesin family protein [Cordyceps fumosorosea ARSEF 2679]OAA54659.1 kinesin family protein [Cordyceps fumosorosea ARSEF 2679]
MDVFVRWRPLVGAESSGDGVGHETVASPLSTLDAVTVQRTHLDKPWKSTFAFSGVLFGATSNASAYSAIVQPAVPHAVVTAGARASFFAYGHSGSGKTHTVIGYEDDDQEQDDSGPGLCLTAAEQLFHNIDAINNARGGMEEPPLAVALSVFELRHKDAFDLLNDGTQCHIREGPDGRVHVRGATETLPDGRVRVQPLSRLACSTVDDLRAALRQALSRRAVGTSSVHDQSSRTHAVIELEVVNAALTSARAALIDRQSELVPVGKRAADVTIAEQARGVFKDEDGVYQPVPGYVADQALLDAVGAEKAAFEARVAAAEAAVDEAYARYDGGDGRPCVGGKMVFVDLAGAEYQQENKRILAGLAQTPAERREARQINTDLLALKEVMRAWATRQPYVPYRSSPLTMVLREAFADDDVRVRRRECSASMVVTVSPAEEQYLATLNSLKYGSLMGTAK